MSTSTSQITNLPGCLDKPNILFLQADQMASNVLPFYHGNGQAIAPNLEKLAKEGVVFENCYCSSPLCSPSRIGMFSGTRTCHNEVWGNGSEFHSDIPTMMHYLKKSGYRTVVSGKTHFIGADQLHGFDKRLTTDIYPSNFSWSIDWKPNVEHRPGTSVKKLEVSGLCKTNNQILYDSEVQFRAVEFLRYEALQPKETPFFLHVSYTQPHESYQTTPKYWDMYDDVEIALPNQQPDSHQDMHPVTRWLSIHHGINQFPPSKEIILASRRAYYAMITHLDEYIGELVDELKALGLYEDTVIIFTSDHGDMLGERGMWFKRSFYDQSVKVPLIFHNPKRYMPKRLPHTVSLMDLMPTIAEIGQGNSELELRDHDDCESFKALLENGVSEWKDYAIIEYFGPGVEEPWLAIRKGAWKYVYTRNHEALLFNILEDPQEKQNLCKEKKYESLMGELHGILLDEVDVDAVTAKAVKNKQTRVFLHEILKESTGYRWDYQPEFDASKQYVRGPNTPSWC